MKEIGRRRTLKQGKRGVIASVFVILVLTFLEFPAPVGFETRSQDNVSRLWFLLFLTILICEISAMALIFRQPRVGAQLAILAAALNIFQIFADQSHMMQPEAAPLGYSLLEYLVGLFALGLVYFAWEVLGHLKKS